MSYVGNNPVNQIDSLGLSELIFNPNSNILTVVDRNGNVISQLPAGNVTDSRIRGPIPPGIYPVGEPIHNVGDRSNRVPSQGPYFIPINDISGISEIGIHGGRTGSLYPTMGCIRTDNEDINSLVDIHRSDPITTITVYPRKP